MASRLPGGWYVSVLFTGLRFKVSSIKLAVIEAAAGRLAFSELDVSQTGDQTALTHLYYAKSSYLTSVPRPILPDVGTLRSHRAFSGI